MNIQGAYKFRTVASSDFFISLYVKIEFFIGSQKISHHEYAQILTQGKVTDFWQLKGMGYHNRYPFRGTYSIDLSPNVVLTLIGVDANDKIVYEREFPKYHQYSIHQLSRLSTWEVMRTPIEEDALVDPENPGSNRLGYPNYPGFQYALADFNAYVDLGSDGNWTVYGIISPNSSLNLGTNIYNQSEPYYDVYDWNFYRSTGHSFGGLYYPILSFKDHEPLVEIGNTSYIKNYQVTGSSLMAHTVNYVGGGLWGCSWYYPYGNSTGFFGNNPQYYPGIVYTSGTSTPFPATMFPGYSFGGGFFATYPPYPSGGYVSANFSSTFAHKYPETQISNPAGFPYFMVDYGFRYTLNSEYYIDIDNKKNITYDLYPVAILHPNNTGYRIYNFSTPLDDPIVKDSKTGSLLKLRSYAWDFDKQTSVLTIDETEMPFSYPPGHNFGQADGSRLKNKSLPGWFYHRRPAFFMYGSDIYTADITYDSTQGKNKIVLEKNFNIPNHELDPIKYPTVLTPYLINKTASLVEQEKVKLHQPFIDALLENNPNGNFPVPYFETRTSSITQSIKYSNRILSGVTCYSDSTKTFWKYCNSVFNPYGVQ